MASIDEELQEISEQQQEEQRQREMRDYAEFEEAQQLDRRQQSGKAAAELRKRTQEAAKKALEKAKKKAEKAVAKSVVRATAPYWVPILLGIIAIIVLVFIVIVVAKKTCDESYATQLASKTLNWTGIIPIDICKQLNFNGGGGGGGGVGYDANTCPKGSDAAARDFLTQGHVSVNADAPQTCLLGINQGTLDEIVAFKKACDIWAAAHKDPACNVVLTGGTEVGHSTTSICSHANGYKFDMGMGGSVDAFIKDTNYFEPNGNRGGDNAPLFIDKATNSIYANETSLGTGPHWDVVVGCGVSEP